MKILKIALGFLVGLAVTAAGAWLASLFVDMGGGEAAGWVAGGFVFLTGACAGLLAGMFIGAERATPDSAAPSRPVATTADRLESAVIVGLAVETATRDNHEDDPDNADDVDFDVDVDD